MASRRAATGVYTTTRVILRDAKRSEEWHGSGATSCCDVVHSDVRLNEREGHDLHGGEDLQQTI